MWYILSFIIFCITWWYIKLCELSKNAGCVLAKFVINNCFIIQSQLSKVYSGVTLWPASVPIQQET